MQNLGFDYSDAGRLDEAIASYRTALSAEPRILTGAHYEIGVALLLKGDAAGGACGDAEGNRRGLAPDRAADGLARAGRQAESDAALAELIAEIRRRTRPTTSPTCSPSAARPTAPSNGSTRRSPTTTRACPEIAVEPAVRELHEDPRWLPFLRKIGKAPEQLAAIKFDVKLPQ